MTSITAAIRADAATSDAEGRAQANEMVTALTIGALAETVTRLNASEDRALRTRRDLIEANQSRNIAIADLNATRERLTTAEAFRDSLQAEADGLRSTVSDMHESWMRKVDAVTAERDAARVEAAGLRIERDAARFACATADEAIAELRARPGLDGDAEQLRCDLQSCRDENSTLIDRIAKVRAEAKRASEGRDAFCEAVMAALGSEDSTADVLASIEALKSERAQFKAEADKLRARPVLTVDMVGRVISTYCDEFAATDREGRADVWADVDQGRRDHAIGVMKSTIDKLGPVTLPAQDRAEDLARAVNHGGGWPITTYAMSSALASLGAPATTPPVTVATLTEDRLADALASLSTWRGERMPWHSDSIRPWASDLMGRIGVVTTPSKPADVATVESVARAIWCAYNNAEATGWSNMTVGVRAMWMAAARAGIAARPPVPADVFAGVSMRDLACVAANADAEYIQPDDGPHDPWWFVVGAVLTALRVKLVAPVDPEAFARAYMERVVPGLYDACKSPSLHFSSMRLELEAKGIPVTPEAGK